MLTNSFILSSFSHQICPNFQCYSMLLSCCVFPLIQQGVTIYKVIELGLSPSSFTRFLCLYLHNSISLTFLIKPFISRIIVNWDNFCVTFPLLNFCDLRIITRVGHSRFFQTGRHVRAWNREEFFLPVWLCLSCKVQLVHDYHAAIVQQGRELQVCLVKESGEKHWKGLMMVVVIYQLKKKYQWVAL